MPYEDPKVTISETHSRDVRVRLESGEAPPHHTPRGKSPMDVRNVHISYQISGRWGPYVELRGERVTDAPRPPYHRGAWPESFTRRIQPSQLSDQPGWLLDLIDEHRPDPAACTPLTRERIEEVLSPYYGALTGTAIDEITDQLAPAAGATS